MATVLIRTAIILAVTTLGITELVFVATLAFIVLTAFGITATPV